jgi:hypothetical protein
MADLHYLLTLHDAVGDTTTTPFIADDDRHAVADAKAYLHHLGATFAGIARMTLDALVLGRFDPASCQILTSSPVRLYDTRDELEPEPDPDSDLDELRGRVARLEDQVAAIRPAPDGRRGTGAGIPDRTLIPIATAEQIARGRHFGGTPDHDGGHDDDDESFRFFAS